MEELKELLINIPESYKDFVDAVIHYAGKKTSRLEAVRALVVNNPDVSSSDVVKFISDQPDFAEDAAYMQVG